MTTHMSEHGPPMPMRSPDLTSNEMPSRTFGPSCVVRQRAGRLRRRQCHTSEYRALRFSTCRSPLVGSDVCLDPFETTISSVAEHPSTPSSADLIANTANALISTRTHRYAGTHPQAR
jgi:hypothetical protein